MINPNSVISSQNDREREHCRIVSLNPTLKTIDELFQDLIKEAATPLKGFFRQPPKSDLFSQKEIGFIANQCSFDNGSYGFGLDYGYYMKIYRSYELCLVEGYEAFIDYVDMEKEKGKSSAKKLFKDERFRKIRDLVNCDTSPHPKVRDLLFLTVDPMYPMWKDFATVVFVNQKSTAESFKCYFNNVHKLKTEAVIGRPKNKKEREEYAEIFRKLESRELDIIFANKVIKEDEEDKETKADLVIHFSMPKRKAWRIARSNIAAKSKYIRGGQVYFICLNHDFDKAPYMSSFPWPKKKKKTNQTELFVT